MYLREMGVPSSAVFTITRSSRSLEVWLGCLFGVVLRGGGEGEGELDIVFHDLPLHAHRGCSRCEPP